VVFRGRTEQTGNFIGNITYFSARQCTGTYSLIYLQQFFLCILKAGFLFMFIIIYVE